MRAKRKSDDVTVCAGAGSPSNSFLMLDLKRNGHGLFMFGEILLYLRNNLELKLAQRVLCEMIFQWSNSRMTLLAKEF